MSRLAPLLASAWFCFSLSAASGGDPPKKNDFPFVPKINTIYQGARKPLPNKGPVSLFSVPNVFHVEVAGLQPNDRIVLFANDTTLDTFLCVDPPNKPPVGFKEALKVLEGVYSFKAETTLWIADNYDLCCLIVRGSQGSIKTPIIKTTFTIQQDAAVQEQPRLQAQSQPVPFQPAKRQGPSGIPSFPFETGPYVTSVPQGSFESCSQKPTVSAGATYDATGCQTNSCQTANGKAILLDHVFRDPAHFPLPAFGVLGERFAKDAFVLYEGMRLLVYADGSYELTMAFEGHDVHATLRFILEIGLPAQGRAFQITVPPVAVPSQVTAIGNYRGKLLHVRQCGFSRELHDLAREYAAMVPPPLRTRPWLCRNDYVVLRDATARFGSLPLHVD